MKTLLFLLLMFTCLFTKAQQTYSINGTVNDEKGQPIPGATVFLTNTKNATATDGSGKFELPGLSAGPYEVVVKMLGFSPDIQTVKIENKAITLNIKLKEANTTLNTVTIKDKPDANRQEYLQWFIENFIGKSIHAAQCKLLNPDELIFYFNTKSNILNAYANDFLIIENDALGYRIKYLLKEFRYYRNSGLCYYEGYPYFEELKGNEEQRKQWEDNRRVAYLGSSRHFLKSVMNNTVNSEGFEIIENTYYPGMSMNIKNFYKTRNADSLFATINNTKALIAKSHSRRNLKTAREEYYVVYKLARQPDLFYKTGYPQYLPKVDQKLQTSKIDSYADTIKINKELLLNPTISFSFSGYWAWERIAEYLPLDYSPDIKR